MSWFQLDPAAVASRIDAAKVPANPPSLAASLARGVIGFAIVSVAGFVPWAIFGRMLRGSIGEAGLYVVCALVFIGLSGLLLHRLIIGPGSLVRFYKLFGIAFAVYAIAWIAGWMILRGNAGGIVGLFIGTALMGWLLATAFDARGAVFKVVAALFLLNTLGYFVGGCLEGSLMHAPHLYLFGAPLAKATQMTLAKLQWGICYGIGLGAGLGLAFYLCQSGVRARLTNRRSET